MFHEHRDIVTKLKSTNNHFKKVFDKHNDLHDQIDKAEEGGMDHINPVEIESMKKKKLKLKDEAYAMIMDFKNKN